MIKTLVPCSWHSDKFIRKETLFHSHSKYFCKNRYKDNSQFVNCQKFRKKKRILNHNERVKSRFFCEFKVKIQQWVQIFKPIVIDRYDFRQLTYDVFTNKIVFFNLQPFFNGILRKIEYEFVLQSKRMQIIPPSTFVLWISRIEIMNLAVIRIKGGSLNEIPSKYWKEKTIKNGTESECKGRSRVGIKTLYFRTHLCTLHFSSQRLFVCVFFSVFCFVLIFCDFA